MVSAFWFPFYKSLPPQVIKFSPVWPSNPLRHDFCVKCEVGVIYFSHGCLCFELYSSAIYLNTSQSSSFWVLSFSIKFQSSFILGKFSSIRWLRLSKFSFCFVLYLRDINYPRAENPSSAGHILHFMLLYSLVFLLCIVCKFSSTPFLSLTPHSFWYSVSACCSVLIFFPSFTIILFSFLLSYHLIFNLIS